MAGSFSGHLIDTFLHSKQHLKGPFGQSLTETPQNSVHGSMSFAPHIHGTFNSQTSLFQETSFLNISEETAQKIASLQAKLDKKLGPEYISQRPGPGGGPKLTYAEGWKIINLANEVFGFNGWSSSVVNLTTDFIDYSEETRRFSVGITAIVKVTLRDGVYHEDIGYGSLENSKSKGAALDKCKKEAVTDAVKRTLRNFGNLLGNCLYDKAYTQEIVKMKVPPPRFNKDDLHRRPEFDESRSNPNPSRSANASTSYDPSVKTERSARLAAIVEACANPAPQPPIPRVPSVVPPHARSNSEPKPLLTPSANGKAPMKADATGSSTVAKSPSDAHATHPPAGPSKAQTERRVSFAPHMVADTSASAATSSGTLAEDAQNDTIEDGEDSICFNSEDDAFLATIDLGEEGIGGPTDYDQGVGGVSPDGGTKSSAEMPPPQFPYQQLRGQQPRQGDQQQPPRPAWQQQQQQQPKPQQRQLQVPPQQVSQQQSNVQQRQQQQLQRRQQIEQQTPQASSVQHSRTLQASSAQQTRPPQAPSHANNPSTSNQRHEPSGSSSNSNPLAQARNSSGLTSQNKGHIGRSPTPSMGGGFKFPPGVAPAVSRTPDLAPSTTRPAHISQASTSGPSGIGLKRDADAMLGGRPTAPQRRPTQGMGLAPHAGGSTRGAAVQRREPLASLDVSDGGEVKRFRLS